MTSDRSGTPDQGRTDEADLTLESVCEMAGVTVRTVRYYIAEGLLPPPVGHGASARYSQEHLDRLDVIAAMKTRFLPLKEIRRMLDGMDRAGLAETAASARQVTEYSERTPPAPRTTAPGRRQVAETHHRAGDAAGYIADLLNRDHPVPAATAPMASPTPASPAAAWRRIPITDDAELLIEDEAYSRRREQIESLVAWAQRILKNS